MDINVGIIIPYYENQPVMRERLEWLLSLLIEQIETFKMAKVEVLVIDDGCNAKWLDKYKEPVIVKHFVENKGVSAARNYGLEYFIDKCDYIGFLDGDDSISMDYVKEAYKLMGLQADFIDSRLVQDGLEVFGTYKGYVEQKSLIRNGVAGCFYKSSIIGDKRFDEKLQIGEDEKWGKEVVDLSKHTKGISNGIYVYNHGINPDSLTMRHARGEIGEEFKGGNNE